MLFKACLSSLIAIHVISVSSACYIVHILGGLTTLKPYKVRLFDDGRRRSREGRILEVFLTLFSIEADLFWPIFGRTTI